MSLDHNLYIGPYVYLRTFKSIKERILLDKLGDIDVFQEIHIGDLFYLVPNRKDQGGEFIDQWEEGCYNIPPKEFLHHDWINLFKALEEAKIDYDMRCGIIKWVS
jgi:hypothetical protein